jgi:uncharacterized protein (DUF1501 family)
MDDYDTNRVCAEFRRSLRVDRRAFLHAGAIGAAGLSLADVLRSDAQAATSTGRKPSPKSVIILWMRGGPSQHDMWDPKPDAPVEIRGEFDPISTSVPGIQICELMPKCAKIMDKWSIVRSMHHRKEDGDVGHSNGDQICFTGYPPGSRPDTNVMPSCGSIVARQLPHLNSRLPTYVTIPKMVPGTGSAWLGTAYNPFETQADPADLGPFEMSNFALTEGLTMDRLRQRHQLLTNLDRLPASEQAAALDTYQRQAVEIVTGGLARDAFDLDQEPQQIRDRYGFMPAFDPGDPQRCSAPNWAQRMLLARRLVEAGVRIVTVVLQWWDFHKEGFDSQRRGFLPRWDQAYSALLEDLDGRGMLDSTLVVAWGEIGRTPRVNAGAGRDHWPHVFSAAFAGGGVKGGRVVGSSDRQGAIPKDNPKLPHDVLATIYRHLGIDVTTNYTDSAGRPHPILPQGARIDELFS